MNASITEIGRSASTAYGVAYYICGNAEVISGGAEHPTGNGWEDAAGKAADAATKIITDAGYDYERVSSFAAYNGGPRRRLVEPAYFVSEIIVEEGEEVLGEWRATWQRGAGATVIPAEVGFAEVERLADQAVEAMAEVMRQASEAAEAKAD